MIQINSCIRSPWINGGMEIPNPTCAAGAVPPSTEITLGILAGGAASRLAGTDKAWLEREGVAQVVRRCRELAPACSAVLVSANRNLERYDRIGLRALRDLRDDRIGPLGGLETLARACRTPWLLTVPVDLVEVSPDVVRRLWSARSRNGSYALDENGPQPLVALWRVGALQWAVHHAIACGNHGIQTLSTELGLARVEFPAQAFGNLNTPADLVKAGMQPASGRQATRSTETG